MNTNPPTAPMPAPLTAPTPAPTPSPNSRQLDFGVRNPADLASELATTRVALVGRRIAGGS